MEVLATYKNGDIKSKVIYLNEHKKEYKNSRLYIRCSTLMQVNDGFSIQTQEDLLKKYCISKYNILGIYYDLGISGAFDIDVRFGLKKIIEDLKSGETCIVVDQNRLFRDVYFMSRLVKDFKTRNIGLSILNFNNGVNVTKEGELTFNILSAVSMEERRVIKERVTKTMQYLVENDKLKPKPSFGWKSLGEKKPLTIEPREYEVIEFIRKLREKDNNIKVARIIDELNIHYPCDSFSNDDPNIKIFKMKKWYNTTIQRIIEDNKIYPYN